MFMFRKPPFSTPPFSFLPYNTVVVGVWLSREGFCPQLLRDFPLLHGCFPPTVTRPLESWRFSVPPHMLDPFPACYRGGCGDPFKTFFPFRAFLSDFPKRGLTWLRDWMAFRRTEVLLPANLSYKFLGAFLLQAVGIQLPFFPHYMSFDLYAYQTTLHGVIVHFLPGEPFFWALFFCGCYFLFLEAMVEFFPARVCVCCIFSFSPEEIFSFSCLPLV